MRSSRQSNLSDQFPESINVNSISISGEKKVRKRRLELNFADRISVILSRDSGKSMRLLADEFGCGKTQILNILNQRDAYLKEWKEKANSKCSPRIRLRKRRRPRTGNEEINRLVWEWYCLQKKSGAFVNGPSLQKEAKSIAQRLGISKFAASNGWLQSFRRLHKIVSFLFISISVEIRSILLFHFEVWQSKRGARSSRSQSNEMKSDGVVKRNGSLLPVSLFLHQNQNRPLFGNSESSADDKSQSVNEASDSHFSFIEDSSVDHNPSIIESLVIKSSTRKSIRDVTTSRDPDDDASIPELIPAYPIFDESGDSSVSTITFIFFNRISVLTELKFEL